MKPAPLWEVIRAHIVATLCYTNGDVARAAEILEIGRTTLYRKLEEFEIEHRRERHTVETVVIDGKAIGAG